MLRRHLMLGAGGLAAWAASGSAAWAQAAPERVYAVMSLVADFLVVTGFESTTGTLVHSNPTERIDLQTDELERVVVRAAVQAVTAKGAGKAVPLITDDGRLYRDQGKLLAGDEVRLPAALLETLSAQKATHLLLTTKHSGPARMRSTDVDLGSGRVEGLGFYIDRVTPLRLQGSGDNAVGYLAPHAYLRLSMIDLSRSRVLASRTITASRVVSPAGGSSGANPWDVMDSAAKMKSLSELIAQAAGPAWREILETPAT